MEKIPANNEGSINDTIINVPIRNTNIGVDVEKCSQCDFALSSGYNLKRHWKTHSGDKSNKLFGTFSRAAKQAHGGPAPWSECTS